MARTGPWSGERSRPSVGPSSSSHCFLSCLFSPSSVDLACERSTFDLKPSSLALYLVPREEGLLPQGGGGAPHGGAR